MNYPGSREDAIFTLLSAGHHVIALIPDDAISSGRRVQLAMHFGGLVGMAAVTSGDEQAWHLQHVKDELDVLAGLAGVA
jgi:hypothetical protein